MHQSAQIFLKFCQGKIIFQDKNDPCGVWQQIDGKFGSIFILADHNID